MVTIVGLLTQLLPADSITQKLKLPTLLVFMFGVNEGPIPMEGGFPIVGSLLYQSRVPPELVAVRVGAGSPAHIGAGEEAAGGKGSESTFTVTFVTGLSQIPKNSVT